MRKGSKDTTPQHDKPPVAASKKFSTPSERNQKASPKDFVQFLPLEICLKIFSQLDIGSLCNAAMTCWSWNRTLESCDHLWKPHCLIVRVVCQREIDGDRGNGYSWKELLTVCYRRLSWPEFISCGEFSRLSGCGLGMVRPDVSPAAVTGVLRDNNTERWRTLCVKVTLLRNYRKSKVKHDWLSGKYSNIRSRSSLPEKSMYPMDVDTWGEILEAELER